MISKVTGYALIFATVLVFNLITIVDISKLYFITIWSLLICSSNFLIAPSYLNKSSSIIVIFINGLFLDYHCNLPLGFNVFLFCLFFFRLWTVLIYRQMVQITLIKSLLLMVNALFFVILFLLIKFKVFSLSEWILSRFFVDLFLSSIVIFFISNPLMNSSSNWGKNYQSWN